MILFENRYASIQKKEDCNILELNWKNFTPSEPLRNILLEFSGFINNVLVFHGYLTTQK